MVHERFEFPMPASAEVVFDAFHDHRWRQRWDSLVHATHVLGGSPTPFVGAETSNAGGGLLRPLSMRTRFISCQPGKVAAATMLGPMTKLVFDWQTRKRFLRMQRFLSTHAPEVEAWQRQGRPA